MVSAVLTPSIPSILVGARVSRQREGSPRRGRLARRHWNAFDGIVWLLARLGGRERYERTAVTRAQRPARVRPSRCREPLHLRFSRETLASLFHFRHSGEGRGTRVTTCLGSRTAGAHRG